VKAYFDGDGEIFHVGNPRLCCRYHLCQQLWLLQQTSSITFLHCPSSLKHTNTLIYISYLNLTTSFTKFTEAFPVYLTILYTFPDEIRANFITSMTSLRNGFSEEEKAFVKNLYLVKGCKPHVL